MATTAYAVVKVKDLSGKFDFDPTLSDNPAMSAAFSKKLKSFASSFKSATVATYADNSGKGLRIDVIYDKGKTILDIQADQIKAIARLAGII